MYSNYSISHTRAQANPALAYNYPPSMAPIAPMAPMAPIAPIAPMAPIAPYMPYMPYMQSMNPPLQNYFSSAAGIDQQLDRNEFGYVYAQMNPQLMGSPYQQPLADNAYLAMDLNRDGRIDYNEFAYGMNALRR